MQHTQQTVQTFYKGPATRIVATVFGLLFITGLAVTAVFTTGGMPTAFSPPEYVHAFYTQYAAVQQVNAMLQFTSAVPLGIFTAAIANKLVFNGARVAGVNIALYGGFAASVFLAVSGLASWVLAQPGMTNNMDVARSLQLLLFSSGGVAHVAALGLLLAGITVPSLFMKLLPKPLAAAGLVIAALCELSVLGMVFPWADIFIPLGRFAAIIWLIAAGFTMPGVRTVPENI